MSEKYDAAVAALSSNEELRKKVMSSTSAEERAGHLRDAGLDIPTHEDINSNLASVTGAGTTTGNAVASQAANSVLNHAKTYADIAAAAGAAG